MNKIKPQYDRMLQNSIIKFKILLNLVLGALKILIFLLT
jgi:hypothetical protein